MAGEELLSLRASLVIPKSAREEKNQWLRSDLIMASAGFP